LAANTNLRLESIKRHEIGIESDRKRLTEIERKKRLTHTCPEDPSKIPYYLSP